MKIVRKKLCCEDSWVAFDEAVEKAQWVGKKVVFPLEHFVNDKSILSLVKASAGEAAVEVVGTDKIGDISQFFPDVSMIVVKFPRFQDGRGFSLARQLRQAGYRGCLRLIGAIIPDQVGIAYACGFDEIGLTNQQISQKPLQQWVRGAEFFAQGYQPTCFEDNIIARRGRSLAEEYRKEESPVKK
jgi:uncharacterized protein (DUF934 family)